MAFKITVPFQGQVLALLVQTQSVLDLYRTSWGNNADFFSNKVIRTLAKMVIAYYEDYNAAPTQDTLKSLLADYLERTEDAVIYQLEYHELLDKIFRSLTEDESIFVQSNLQEAMRDRLVERALMKVHSMADEGAERYGEMIETLEKATTFSFLKDADGWVEYEDMSTFNYDTERESDPIATGFRYLDVDLHGGSRPGELCIVAAPSGAGKSQFLVNLAKGAMEANKKVFFLTFEIPDRPAQRRFDSLITNTDFWMLKENIVCNLARPKKEKWLEDHPGALLRIKHWPMQSMTIKQIAVWIKKFKGTEYFPDVLFFDSGDHVIPGRHFDNMYESAGQVYGELKSLAQELKIPVWSSCQTNRASMTARNVDAHHMAESLKKVQLADLILTVSQTEDEKRVNACRLLTAKARRHMSNRTYYFTLDFTRSKVSNISQTEANTTVTGHDSIVAGLHKEAEDYKRRN